MTKLAFLSHHDHRDKNSFSGSAYYLFEALANAPNLQVEALCYRQTHAPKQKHLYDYLGNSLSKLVQRTGLSQAREANINKLAADAYQALQALKPKLILCLAATELLSKLKQLGPLPPVIFVSDATPLFLRHYYGKTISAEQIQNERECLSLAHRVLYSSSYMAKIAQAEYPECFISPGKLSHQCFGLNLREPTKPQLEPPLHTIKLLFIGADWQRKGGDIALECALELIRRGHPVELNIIGSAPAHNALPNNIKILGRLNKNRAEQAQQLKHALSTAHLLLLPTRADCTPMVIAEANAYACPVLASRTGGIPDLVTNQHNGYLLETEAKAMDYAEHVLTLLAEPEAYYQLRQRSLAHYRSKLRWSSWPPRILEILKQLP